MFSCLNSGDEVKMIIGCPAFRAKIWLTTFHSHALNTEQRCFWITADFNRIISSSLSKTFVSEKELTGSDHLLNRGWFQCRLGQLLRGKTFLFLNGSWINRAMWYRLVGLTSYSSASIWGKLSSLLKTTSMSKWVQMEKTFFRRNLNSVHWIS